MGLPHLLHSGITAIVLAITFSQAESIESALGSNLVGAMLGSMIEYSSLALGIRSLYIFALLFL